MPVVTGMNVDRGGGKLGAKPARQTGAGAKGERDDKGRADGASVEINLSVTMVKKTKKGPSQRFGKYVGTIMQTDSDGTWMAKTNKCGKNNDCDGCDQCVWYISDDNEAWCVLMCLSVCVCVFVLRACFARVWSSDCMLPQQNLQACHA